MTERSDTPLIAVLIDADNTSPKYAKSIFDEIARLGEASVRRCYGDFSSQQMAGWSKVQAEFGLVPHHQPANTVVMAVSTRDLDEAENADVEYFLSKSDSDNFEIGRLDGIIRTRGGLDREERSEYSVLVTARDQGSPPLSASMEITITVLDQNVIRVDKKLDFERKTAYQRLRPCNFDKGGEEEEEEEEEGKE